MLKPCKNMTRCEGLFNRFCYFDSYKNCYMTSASLQTERSVNSVDDATSFCYLVENCNNYGTINV